MHYVQAVRRLPRTCAVEQKCQIDSMKAKGRVIINYYSI